MKAATEETEAAAAADDDAARKQRRKEKRKANSAKKKADMKQEKKRKREEEEEEDKEASTCSTQKKRNRSKKRRLNKRTMLAITPGDEVLMEKLKTEPTVVLLDFENVSYPKSGIYEIIKKKLEIEGYSGDIYLNVFVGYIGDTVPNIDGNKSFQHYGDPIKNRPDGSRNDQKADTAMKDFVDRYLYQPVTPSRPPANFLFITNDKGYRGRMNMLRRGGHVVLLASTAKPDAFPEAKSQVLQCGAHKFWDWDVEFMTLGKEEVQEEDQA